MARPRRQQKQEITSEEVGSWEPEQTSIAVAQPGEYPEGYEDASDGWKAAFDHAARHGNPEKGSILYADAHDRDYEAPSEEELRAEIERLQKQLDASAS